MDYLHMFGHVSLSIT